MNASDFLKALFDFLNSEANYAVLRNYEGLPLKNNSRDIDIAIEKRTFLNIRSKLVELIEKSEWKIITYLNSDRLITWVCGIVHEDKSLEIIQLDFFYHTSVFGIILLENKVILENRIFNGSLYHVNKTYEFLDKYLYDRVVGATYPDKYKETRLLNENSQSVNIVIKKVFRKEDLKTCDKTLSKKLLMNALIWNFKKFGLKTFSHVLSFEYHHLKNYFCSNTGFSIGFTGPDGSGKTTIINQTIKSFGAVFHNAYRYYHFRPQLFGNLGDVAQSAKLRRKVDREYEKPHRGRKTSIFNSLCRLTYYSIDYILGYWIKVKSTIRITRITIFDRYYTDIICDSKRSRIFLNYKFLYWFGRLFIPFLDYNILLTANTKTILDRKKELTQKDIEEINKKIGYLSTKKGYKRIINDQTQEIAVAEIFSYVFEEQNKKNLKRLKYKKPQ
jgi:thymidylate kinase